VSDPANGLEEARRAAVESATDRARQLVVAAGVTLGPLRSLREPAGEGGGLRGFAASASARPARLDAGESVLTVSVGMTWAINQPS